MKKINLFLRNIKKGFATNSSSYHSMIVVKDEEMSKWRSGEIEIDGYSYDEWFDNDYAEYDDVTIEVGGERVTVYCQYGHD